MKYDFRDFSPSAKKIILSSALRLPWGRFLAAVSPSVCKKALEPDTIFPKQNPSDWRSYYSPEVLWFSEAVSRLCRFDPSAKQFLMYGPNCGHFYPPDLCRYKEDLAEEIFRQFVLFLRENPLKQGVEFACSEDVDSYRHYFLTEVRWIRTSVSKDMNRILFTSQMREERSDIALGVKLVSLLSAIEKDRYGTLSCDFTPHGVTIFGAFGAQIPEKPELPDDDKSPAELGIPCGEYEERRDEILSPWREEIFSVIEHSFAGMGIPLKS